jgi:DNA segregation ATPase FtsK/SpoIIIE, S-DNA-T family
MSRRKYGSMARPRGGAAKSRKTTPKAQGGAPKSHAAAPKTRSSASTSRRPSSSASTGAKPTATSSPLQRAAQGIWNWARGPAGQQILSLALIALGLVTLITLIPGVNSGDVVGVWVRLLVLLFGWAAYPVAAMFVALGLLWLRHLVHRATAWRWRPFLGFELILLGLQTLTYTLISREGWVLVEAGTGGGLIGWALYQFLAQAFNPLTTGVLMGISVCVGLALAFDLTGKDLQLFGRRLSEVRLAWEAERQIRAKERARLRRLENPDNEGGSYSPAKGVVVSPLARSPVPESSTPSPPRFVPQAARGAGTSPRIHEPQPIAKPRRAKASVLLVPLTLLRESASAGMNPDEIQRKSGIIEKTLEQFGVPGRVTEVRPGPTVTQFGVSPGYINRGVDGEDKRKVRVSQIASLADDLALALAARSLRVEAPVPGRAVVGIEVPNADISTVRLRSVLESDAFHKCGRPLCFAVGLDVAGAPQVADLSRMPHLLVAGTTGSGKSVFVKALAASLVMHNSPETLRLIAIDPKMVELSHLNGLPHLLGSAETEVEQGLRVLRWVAHEMDERYKLFAKAVSRNLDDYNARLARRRGHTASTTTDAGEEPLPRIVVLIDELADLMMTAPEDTERTLTRIAQMARATGIHLVVATQRPSTDVVTGLIKANFPARISFATASGVDSRVIIDTPGAESLLGQGDMLFMPPDASAPMRVQGCYITDDELEAIIKYWQKEVGATPAKAPWEAIAEAQGPEHWRMEGLHEDADLLDQAIAYAKSRGRVSTSGIQRHLRISYPRAARLMEQMETIGLVEPQVSAGKKRRVILGGDDE